KQSTDANGSVVTRTFDALNRLTQVDVVRGTGVGGTTQQTYGYDGLSRLTSASDDNGTGHLCEYVWDSLSRKLEEGQDGQAISSRYTGDGKRREVVYPGGRTIDRTFDALDRIKTLADGNGLLAASDWVGPGLRELRRTNRNGTSLSFLNDAGTQDTG